MTPSERLEDTERQFDHDERMSRGLAQVDVAIEKFNMLFHTLKFVLDDLQEQINILKEQKK